MAKRLSLIVNAKLRGLFRLRCAHSVVFGRQESRLSWQNIVQDQYSRRLID
jgi:hypothetical protein